MPKHNSTQRDGVKDFDRQIADHDIGENVCHMHIRPCPATPCDVNWLLHHTPSNVNFIRFGGLFSTSSFVFFCSNAVINTIQLECWIISLRSLLLYSGACVRLIKSTIFGFSCNIQRAFFVAFNPTKKTPNADSSRNKCVHGKCNRNYIRFEVHANESLFDRKSPILKSISRQQENFVFDCDFCVVASQWFPLHLFFSHISYSWFCVSRINIQSKSISTPT